MVSLLFTSRFLGAGADLHVELHDDGSVVTSWLDSDTHDRDTWIIDDEMHVHVHDVLALLTIAGIETSFPDVATVRMCSELGMSRHDAQWLRIMPRWKVTKMLREITRDFLRVLDGPDGDYYTQVMGPTRRLVGSLMHAHVDRTRLEAHMHAGGGNIPALESFRPDVDDLVQRPVYDFTSGRTGRMKVSQGPQILTLARQHRDVITSRWPGGRVVMLDFMSLEARVAALTAGKTPPDDLYAMIASDVLADMSRDDAKVVTLTAIYGGGQKLLQTQGLTDDRAQLALKALREYFNIDNVVSQLSSELSTSGAIRSIMGRRVTCPNSAPHIVYNSYVQASGVDVALLGFNGIWNEMQARQMKSGIMFLLQDACILDVHPDELMYIQDLCDVGSHVTCYEHARFPLRCKELTA